MIEYVSQKAFDNSPGIKVYYMVSNDPYEILEMMSLQLKQHGLKIVILDMGFENNYPDSNIYAWKIVKS